MITSRHHPKIKGIRALAQKKYRQQTGQAFLEGMHLVREALTSSWPVFLLVYTPYLQQVPGGEAILALAEQKALARLEVSPEVMASLAQTETPPPVGAVIGQKEYDLEQLLQHPPVVLLDGLQDPGNVGTIIRAAAALGGGGVVLGEGSADLYNAKTLRATMGALFKIPIVNGADLVPIAAKLGEKGWSILGAEARGGVPPWLAVGEREDFALVIGHETRGVGQALRGLITTRVTIPMSAGVESLNAAMAGTILLYELWRHRQFQEKNNTGEK